MALREDNRKTIKIDNESRQLILIHKAINGLSSASEAIKSMAQDIKTFKEASEYSKDQLNKLQAKYDIIHEELAELNYITKKES